MENFFIQTPSGLTPLQVLIQAMPKNSMYKEYTNNVAYRTGDIVYTYETDSDNPNMKKLVLYEKLTNDVVGVFKPLTDKTSWKKLSLFGGGGGGGLSIYDTKQEATDAGSEFYGITVETKTIQIDSRFLGEIPTD